MALASMLAIVFMAGADPAPAPVGPATITVHADKVTNTITPYMTGACIEDVNHEVYGGIYSQMIFGESFEEPPFDSLLDAAGFSVFGGKWALGQEGVEVEAGAGPKAVARDWLLGDGEVEVSVFFPGKSGDNAGLIARVREAADGADAFDGYEISLSATGNYVRLGRHRHDWRHFGDFPCEVPAGRWIRLGAAFRGPVIEVSVDGRKAASFTDPSPLPAGSVGVRTWNSLARFRDLVMRSGGQVREASLRRPPAAGPVQEASGPWKIVRTGTAVSAFALEDGAFHGKRCQKISFVSGEGTVGVENMGLNRWGLSLAAGKPYEGQAFLRADGEARVSLALLDDTGRPAAKQVVTVRGDWRPYAIALTPDRSAAAGRFAVLLERPGTVWADMVFLQPGPWGRFRDLPVRRDIAEGLLAEGLTALRLGGSMVNADEYRWKGMIGPRELRPGYRGTWYPHSTNGWGIVDFLDLCERSRFLPVVAINIEETPEDAAGFIEYANGAAATEWGRRRALDGHPRPYRLRHVEIGNEETLNDHYVERFRLLADTMAARDPGLTFVIAAWFDEKNPAARKLVELSRGKKVLWDVHVGGDGLRDADRDGKAIERMRALFADWAPDAGVKVCILEENGGRHDIARALGHAHMVNTMERLGDFVLIDCPANCLQPYRQNDNGWDQGQLFFTSGKVWGMPPYYAQQMIAAARQPRCLAVEAAAPKDALDVTATASEDGRTVVVKVVNIEAEAVPARIEFRGFEPRSPTALVAALGGALDARNSPEEPERIVPREDVLAAGPDGFRPTFAPHSFTVIRFR